MKVKVIDVLHNKCPYEGCKHNSQGTCYNEDTLCNLGRAIQEDLFEDRIHNDSEYECDLFELKDENVCEYGHHMLFHSQKSEYAGSEITETLTYCPECD